MIEVPTAPSVSSKSSRRCKFLDASLPKGITTRTSRISDTDSGRWVDGCSYYCPPNQKSGRSFSETARLTWMPSLHRVFNTATQPFLIGCLTWIPSWTGGLWNACYPRMAGSPLAAVVSTSADMLLAFAASELDGKGEEKNCRRCSCYLLVVSGLTDHTLV